MALYEFGNKKFEKIPQTSFVQERIRERDDIQEALKANIDIIASDCLVIAEEYSEWSESQRRIDLLAIDKDAKIVVIELKRDETGSHMELQAIRYAAMISSLKFSQAVEIFKKFIEENHLNINPEEKILSFLGWDIPNENEFANDIRIILVSANFDKEITSSVLWLNERDLDIQCVRMKPYKTNEGKFLIDIHQVIPLPEASDYMIRAQKKSEVIREERISNKDYTKYRFNNMRMLSKGRTALEVIREYVSRNPLVTFDELNQLFPKDRLTQNAHDVFQKENEISDERGYFRDADDVIELSDARVCVSKKWGNKNGVDRIARLTELVKDYGLVIEVDE